MEIVNQITNILIMSSAVIESAMLSSYLIALYLLYTSNIVNGLQKSLMLMFASGAIYSLSLLVLLFLLINNYFLVAQSNTLFPPAVVVFFTTRTFTLISRLYLSHELRSIVVRQKGSEKDIAAN